MYYMKQRIIEDYKKRKFFCLQEIKKLLSDLSLVIRGAKN